VNCRHWTAGGTLRKVAQGSGKRAPRGQRRANGSKTKTVRSQRKAAAAATALVAQDSTASQLSPQRAGQLGGNQAASGADGDEPPGLARKSSLQQVRSALIGERCRE
jgi:hypothetical protein